MAAVAYILLWITGLIVLLTAKKEEKYKRWHAIQAIGLGIALTALYIVIDVLLIPLAFTAPALAAMASLLTLLVNLVILIAIILMAVQAYQGKSIRLPVISDYADKNA